MELKYKDGTPMRKYNSPKLQELEQINQDNPVTRGSTALVYKQETLEEAAENYGWKIKTNTFSDPVKANELAESAKQDFIEGAKWMQERMYSEEDLRNAYRWGTTVSHGTKEHFNEWFEQFKKK